MQPRNKNLLVLGLLAFGVVMRVLPYVIHRLNPQLLSEPSSYAWNVSPVPAMCLLGGAYLSSRWAGLGVGFLAYLFSDVLIGWVSGNPAFSFYTSLPFVYAGFILHGVIGTSLRGRNRPVRVACTALASELAFFLLTNFGVWATGEVPYEKSPSGLLTCYLAAVPFLWKSLYGTLIYSAVFFEIARAAERRFGQLQPALAPVPSQDRPM